ncbi:MAG: OmpH family outer membrane protein [Proteobacteria bacterium]|jgi:outer membrane protein|nr:OmpH family outer membrane protein [Pseudomonadota bacterium]MDA1301366.1 OmpH family outer membrane protein [Pseudomonadota bacterium]
MRHPVLAIAASLLLMVLSAATLAEVKIAVVNVQQALVDSDEAKALLAQIQEELKPQEAAIRKLQSDAAALLERMQKDADVMSETQKRKLSEELETKNQDFQYERQKLQRLAEARQQELFAGTQHKLSRAIEELVRTEDYDIILPSNAALYVGDVYDITRRVTEQLNAMGKKQ